MSDTQLLALLANPITFGAMISWFFEQVVWFKDPRNSNWLKLAIVAATCLAWSIIVAVLTKDGWITGAAEWKAVIFNAFAVLVSSQIVNVLLPGLKDFLKSLTTPASTVTVTTTDNAGTSTTQAVVVNAPELAEVKG